MGLDDNPTTAIVLHSSRIRLTASGSLISILSADGKVLSRNHLAISIFHITFFICHCLSGFSSMTNEKCDMENGNWKSVVRTIKFAPQSAIRNPQSGVMFLQAEDAQFAFLQHCGDGAGRGVGAGQRGESDDVV